MKADEILSDFSEEMIIRFFYRRKPSLPYACTPCETKSNTPNDFISLRFGSAKKAQTEKADKSVI